MSNSWRVFFSVSIITLLTLIIPVLTLWFFNHHSVFLAKLSSITANSRLDGLFPAYQLLIASEKLDFSSYAFGLVALAVASVSVYWSLNHKILEDVAEEILKKHKHKYFPQDSKFDDCIQIRFSKDSHNVEVDSRNPDRKTLFSFTRFAEKKEIPVGTIIDFNSVISKSFNFLKTGNDLLILFYTTGVACAVYFLVPFFYYYSSILAIYSLVFLYAISIIIFLFVLYFANSRKKIIEYWEANVPVWLENGKNHYLQAQAIDIDPNK